MLSVGVLKTLGTHMSSREAAKMGDILATEADLLWMVKEVRNSDFENAQRTSCKPESAPIVKSQIKQDAQRFFNELCLI